jgi:hypothetical protein
MNRKIQRIAKQLAAGASLLCAVSAIQAATTANTSARVYKPLTVTGTANLAFGSFTVSGSTPGTVVVTTLNARTQTGGVTLVPTGATTVGTLEIDGETGATYSLTVTPTVLTHTNNTDTMSLATIHALDTGTTSTSSGGPATGTLDGTTGKQNVLLGGILTVVAGQVPGSYSGTISATVAYN